MRDQAPGRRGLTMRGTAYTHLPVWLGLLALILGAGLAGGCGQAGEDAAITVTWRVDPDPPTVGPATVAVILADSTGQPVTGADVVLEGTMTHPGMQPARSAARETAPGRYEAVLDLTMGGDWILLLEASLPNGRTVRRQHDLRGIRTL